MVYTAGDGNLVDNGDGTWELTIPAGSEMVDGTYEVVATVTDALLATTATDTHRKLMNWSLTQPRRKFLR